MKWHALLGLHLALVLNFTHKRRLHVDIIQSLGPRYIVGCLAGEEEICGVGRCLKVEVFEQEMSFSSGIVN